MKESRMSTRYMAAVAMFAAVSYVAVLVSKVIPNVAGFLSYEPKDAVIVIAGLLYGPLTSVLISVIVSFIEMITISSTGPYGLLMNIVSTCAFAVPAAWYYQKHRTQKDAVIGLSFGVLAMVAAMLLWNYIITPFYMGVPREQVAGMLQRMLKLRQEDMSQFMDATDALAAAYCHYLQMGRPVSEAHYRSWKDFVNKNKDKVTPTPSPSRTGGEKI